MIRRVHFIVSGRVQGVFYRGSAQKIAQSEGLAGWVRNTDEGNVEGEVEGEAAAVERFIAWCRTGPRAAEVANVSLVELAKTNMPSSSFEIRR